MSRTFSKIGVVDIRCLTVGTDKDNRGVVAALAELLEC